MSVIALIVLCFGAILLGYPVAFALGGTALLFALAGAALGTFDLSLLHALPGTIYGVMTSDLLVAVPLFVFMGLVLERSRIAEELLETMAACFGRSRGGLSVSVLLVGALLAASTGIVGATVVTMGLISLPVMLRAGYCPRLAAGTICASGTLGQIIPPSVVLILLADQLSGAWQATQMAAGVTTPVPISIADLFVGALVPGLGLVALYIIWQYIYGALHPGRVPVMPFEDRAALFEKGALAHVLEVLLPPVALIGVVLGSILAGVATATESAAIGASGALMLAALRRRLSRASLRAAMEGTLEMSSMVFLILIGAAVFTLVFRGYGGDALVAQWLSALPGGLAGALVLTMVLMFLLGFFIDFVQIIYVVVPIVAPVLLGMGANPVWLAVMMAVNLQTSFLTPPFGFALFYLRGVAPPELRTSDIYKGALPFIGIQLLMLAAIAALPVMATGLPKAFYGSDFTLPDIHEAQPLRDHFAPSANSWEINF